MKKIISAVAALLLLTSLCSCGGSRNNTVKILTDETTAAASTETGDDTYAFVSGGVTVHMNDVMENGSGGGLRKKLGEPVSYEESNSCAYQGLDKVYTYKGFTIYTYPEGNTDYILMLVLTDDTVTTPTGIGIGSTAGDAAKAYGGSWDGNDGKLEYTSGTTRISIQITGGIVKALQYDYIG